MRENLHQYNLKNPNDPVQNSSGRDRSNIPPKKAQLPSPKTNYMSTQDMEQKSDEDLYVEDFIYENNSNDIEPDEQRRNPQCSSGLFTYLY